LDERRLLVALTAAAALTRRVPRQVRHVAAVSAAVAVAAAVLALAVLPAVSSYHVYHEFTSEPFSAPIPSDWKLTRQSGHIADVCFGGWNECGTIARSYNTKQSPIEASEALRLVAELQGWSVDLVPERPTPGVISGSMTNKPRNHTKIAHFSLADEMAHFTYVEQ